MKILGRIILLIVGGCMIGFAIPTIIANVNNLQAASAEWWNISKNWSYLWPIVSAGLNCLGGLIAIFGAIRGKKSLRLAIVAAILLVFPIVTLVTDINNGTTIDMARVWYYVSSFALPVGYFIGFLLV